MTPGPCATSRLCRRRPLPCDDENAARPRPPGSIAGTGDRPERRRGAIRGQVVRAGLLRNKYGTATVNGVGGMTKSYNGLTGHDHTANLLERRRMRLVHGCGYAPAVGRRDYYQELLAKRDPHRWPAVAASVTRYPGMRQGVGQGQRHSTRGCPASSGRTWLHHAFLRVDRRCPDRSSMRSCSTHTGYSPRIACG
jgi:hypothetical protein